MASWFLCIPADDRVATRSDSLRSCAFQRKFLAVILVFLSLGLVSLGIKVPHVRGFSSPAKPKPSPRAVVQNQIKTCKQLVANPDTVGAVTRTVFVFLASQPLLHEVLPYCGHVEIVHCIPSRASPRLS